MIFKMVGEMAKKQNAALDEFFFTRRLVREYSGWTV